MQTQIKKLDNLLWLNIVEPEVTEVRKLLAENSMNESLADEIVEPTLQVRADTLRNALFLTLSFPIKRGEDTFSEEVNFLIKSNLIISCTKKEISAIKDFVENLDKVVINTKYNNQTHGGVYFVHFLKSIYKNLEDTLQKISTNIVSIEKNLLTSDESFLVREIVNISKKVSDIYLPLKSHKDLIKIYADESTRIFGIEYQIYDSILQESCGKISSLCENQKHNLKNLKTSCGLLIANKNKQVLKVLTVVTIVILPMIFIASFFSMTSKFPNDLVASQFGTIYVMAIMLVVSLLTICYLHFKKLI